MEKDQLIPADEFCAGHDIEITFITSLHDSGLIEVIRIEERPFIDTEQLQQLEKMVHLHYDLDINLEGIETVTHLLDTLQRQQKEIIALKNAVNFYQHI